MMNSNRYRSHYLLPEIGVEGQSVLDCSKVLIVGVGGLGSVVAPYLTASGVGCIGLVDEDIISESNLQRQLFYAPKDVGSKKINVLANTLRSQNPDVVINTFDTYITIDNISQLIANYDVIVDCSDNYQTRFLINDACVFFNKPLVYASVEQFVGQVSVFNFQGGPTYRCLYREDELLTENSGCQQSGVLGPLVGVVGSLQAVQAMSVLLKLPGILSGKLLHVDALTMQFIQIDFTRMFDYHNHLFPKPFYLKTNASTVVDKFDDQTQILTVLSTEELVNPQAYFIVSLQPEISEKFTTNNLIVNKTITMAELADVLDEVPPNSALLFVCKNGVQSKIAALMCRQEYAIQDAYSFRPSFLEN